MEGLKLGKIQLEGQCIGCSGTTERRDIEKQHDMLPAQIVVKFDCLCRRARQCEGGHAVPNLQGHGPSSTEPPQYPHSEEPHQQTLPTVHRALVLQSLNRQPYRAEAQATWLIVGEVASMIQQSQRVDRDPPFIPRLSLLAVLLAGYGGLKIARAEDERRSDGQGLVLAK